MTHDTFGADDTRLDDRSLPTNSPAAIPHGIDNPQSAVTNAMTDNDLPEQSDSIPTGFLPDGVEQPDAMADRTPQEPNCKRDGRAKRQPGGQPGNRSAMRFGLRSNRSPPDAAFIDVSTDVIRRNVEDALVSAKGAVSLSDAFVVNSIARHESRAQKIAHYLRSIEGAALTIVERCQLLAQISDATDRRDRAMRLLNLDTDNKQSIIAQLYGRPDSNAQRAPQRNASGSNEETAAPTNHNAPTNAVGNNEGDSQWPVPR